MIGRSGLQELCAVLVSSILLVAIVSHICWFCSGHCADTWLVSCIALLNNSVGVSLFMEVMCLCVCVVYVV